MNGKELLKKLKKFSKNHDLSPPEVKKSRGKGSHGTLYFNGNRTTFKDPKEEIGEGLLCSMLKNLGVDKNEL